MSTPVPFACRFRLLIVAHPHSRGSTRTCFCRCNCLTFLNNNACVYVMVRAGVVLLLWSTRARLPPGIFTFRTKIATEGTFTNNQQINSPKNSKSHLSRTPLIISVEYSLHETMSSSSSSEDDDEDLFYAPSYNRKREEEKKNNALGTTSNNGTNKRKVEEEEEEEERKRTRALISDSDDDDDDDDDETDDEKDDDDEEEEEKEEEKPTSNNALVSESSDSDAPPSSTLARRDRAHYNDEKMREASALMRELTKKTDARVFEDENDGDEQRNGVAASDDNVGALGANGAEDDEDEDDVRYEPIQLVFAFSNTKKVEFETSKRYTFERIWKDFVDEHHPEGDVAKAKFTFDGDRIKVSEDTPETLDMDDEDVVDVLL